MIDPKVERFLDIARALNSELELDKLLELLMDSVIEVSGAERGFLILPDGGEFSVHVSRNMDREEVQKAHQKVSRTVLQKVLSGNKPIVLTDAQEDPEFGQARSVQAQKVRSICAFPLKSGAEVVGAIYLDHRFREGVFSGEDMALLNAFGHQAAVAIKNAMLFTRLRQSKTEIERLQVELEKKVEHQEAELLAVRTEMAERSRYADLVGSCRPMQELYRVLDKVAGVNLPVLIQGESGTGKELVARAIHFNGPRKEKSFISANCGAIPDTLLASELFGHVRGSFTGADRDKKGLFELAHGGTLFLDEIAVMSMEMQESLLRALQEGEIRPVGGKSTLRVDVRLVAACNVDLSHMVEDGLFRQDLYFRLNVLPVSVPPLRERRDDLPVLVDHFLERAAEKLGVPQKRITQDALAILLEYAWPGNVRELENVINQAMVMSDGDALEKKDFQAIEARIRAGARAPSTDSIMTVDEYARSVYVAHAKTMDHKAVADKLGISRKSLWEKRKKWGL